MNIFFTIWTVIKYRLDESFWWVGPILITLVCRVKLSYCKSFLDKNHGHLYLLRVKGITCHMLEQTLLCNGGRMRPSLLRLVGWLSVFSRPLS